MHELPDELPNDLRLKILGNQEISRIFPEMSGIDGKYPTGYTKGKF